MEQKKKRRNWNSKHYPRAISVRVTDEEHEEILGRAELTGLSTSRYLVTCSLSKPMPKVRERVLKTDKDREQIEMLLRQLWKIGTNLNQLAHGYNLSRYGMGQEPSQDEVQETARAVQRLIEEIKNRL